MRRLPLARHKAAGDNKPFRTLPAAEPLGSRLEVCGLCSVSETVSRLSVSQESMGSTPIRCVSLKGW